MQPAPLNSPSAASRPALVLSLCYAGFAGSWIVWSDLALSRLDPSLQTVKGLLFVGVTAGLLYCVLRRQFGRRARAEQRTERAIEDLRHAIEASRGSNWELLTPTDDADLRRARFRVALSPEQLAVLSEVPPGGSLWNWLALMPDDDRSRVLGQLRLAIGEDLEVFETNFRIRTSRATMRWFQCRGRRDRRHQEPRWSGIIWDVTEHQNAVERAEMLHRTFESVTEGIAIADRDGHVLTTNNAFEKLIGLPRDKLLGRPFAEIVFDDSDADAADNALRHVRVGGLWQGIVREVDELGSQPPLLLRLSALHRRDGDVGQFMLLLSDMGRPESYRERLDYLQNYDELTGLPNLRRFCRMLQLRMDNEEALTLLAVDVDRFQSVVEGLGKDVADGVLSRLALRLCEIFGPRAQVARAEGDCFAVALSGTVADSVVDGTLERLSRDLQGGILVGGSTVCLTVSVGIASAPADGSDAAALFEHANSAMIESKRARAGRFRRYDSGINLLASERVSLVADLRAAFSNGTLVCHYQPQVTVRTREIVGAEALLRWRRGGKWIPPSTFVPLAHEAGLDQELGLFVLGTVCRQLARWRRETSLPDDFRVAVNLSPDQFDNRLDIVVCEVLARYRLPARCLELELTEAIAANTQDAGWQAVRRLRGEGVRFSVDDFGTGFSSLGRLRDLPLDQLKVDRSFVADLPDTRAAGMVRAIQALGDSLDVDVIAEGVETEIQHGSLQSLGCRYAQGYLYGRAIPADEFATHWLPSVAA